MQRLRQATDWQAYETRGQSVQTSGQEITPIGRVAQVRWPGGGLVWHRPVAVEVRQGARTFRLPIYNATRRAIALFFAGLAIGVLGLALAQRVFQARSNTR